MDNENLDYVSSVDPFQADKKEPSVDVADEKALVRLVRVVDEQYELFHTISGMRLFPKEFNADQREAMCAQYVTLLASLKQLITNAIDGIKEAGK